MTRFAAQIVDLGFGDSGKGTMVDYLARKHRADLVVRFNGGPQAGHNVVLPDGRHHCFSQFGSASFVPGVRTLLSRFTLVEPYAMLNEAAHLESIGVRDALARTFIDERCLVITPMHAIANRLRERARGTGAHGTCGIGFGECVSDSIQQPDFRIFAAEFRDAVVLRRKLRAVFDHKRAELAALIDHASDDERRVLDDPTWIDAAVQVAGRVASDACIVSAGEASACIRGSVSTLYEAAQGVLLDENFGFHPHTTWSTTTFANADALIRDAGADTPPLRVGVTRSYHTRHGAGPFPSERAELTHVLPEPHNVDHGAQGAFRRGVLDLALVRYAIDACGGIDQLAITHLDRLAVLPSEIVEGYEDFELRFDPAASLTRMEEVGQRLRAARPVIARTGVRPEAFCCAVEQCCGVRVAFHSFGPTFEDKCSL